MFVKPRPTQLASLSFKFRPSAAYIQFKVRILQILSVFWNSESTAFLLIKPALTLVSSWLTNYQSARFKNIRYQIL